jgi:hypothetical protein
MAIEPAMARLLLLECARRPLRGSVLQLGRQTILFNEKQLRNWASETRTEIGSVDGVSNRNGTGADGHGNSEMNDERYFRMMGFGEVASCDFSHYENATFVMDLNQPVKPEFHNRFDMIFDGGTMEHVFNVPMVFANIHSMLKIGGRVLHVVPSSNMVDHGFYSFSPTLFRDFYRSNAYSLVKLYLFECSSWGGKWTVYDCLDRCPDSRLGRIASARMAGIFCIAEKTEASTANVVPSQGHFSDLWTTAPSVPNGQRDGGWRRSFKSSWPKLAEIFYQARALAWRVPVFRRSSLPPVVGKF